MEKNIKISDFKWINQPTNFELKRDNLTIQTQAKTDFWQRTYYGFQNDNAPGLLLELTDDFTFTVKTSFEYKNQFDQCGILLYQDSENWIKASIEKENETIARLGSVVSNFGYSDWATSDIPSSISVMWYRLSRRGLDFFIECSEDGENFKQMRILHMHKLIEIARVGVYACSPLTSSFKVIFSEFKIESCKWELHS
jgi:regulation of enolase protein 1 (concanavalin A-like superfamily)